MRDAGIGRVLVAALHQGIADELPDRLEFYENWLNAEGLRNGTIGLAPLAAVLGFLRTEGDAYDAVTRRAGEYAADWMVEELPPGYRRLISRVAGLCAPHAGHARRSKSGAASLQRQPGDGARPAGARRSGASAARFSASVRGRSERPLCVFYAAAVARVLRLLEVEACRCRRRRARRKAIACATSTSSSGPRQSSCGPTRRAEGALQ